MATAPLSPSTACGVGLHQDASHGSLAAAPSWSDRLLPHAQTEPSWRSARVWPRPAATAVTPSRPLTCTGPARSAYVPSPSCPEPLAPHAHTLPDRPGSTGPAVTSGGGGVL